MAFRTWGRLLLTALGVSVLAGAGQLGVAYGFGIVRLTGAFTGTTVNQWPAQLVWVGWFAANAAVAGAVLTGRLAHRDAPAANIGPQLAIGGAAALGATVIAPLCMQPARAAELISVDPVWAVGICAVVGAVIGAGAAIAVLLRPELGWNMAAVAGAVWLLALISVLPSLGTTGPLATVRLGVLEPSWLTDDAAQRLALLLLPTVALLAGAATAGLARSRGHNPLVSGATGVAGPVLVAFAYLTAGPGDAVDRYQATPYYAALIAILAGALGAAAAALLRWPTGARTADPQAIEPTAILSPLPAGPALPGATSASPTDDRETAAPTDAQPANAELSTRAESRGAVPGQWGSGDPDGVRTVPAHWDWPASTPSGQHGPTPAAPATPAAWLTAPTGEFTAGAQTSPASRPDATVPSAATDIRSSTDATPTSTKAGRADTAAPTGGLVADGLTGGAASSTSGRSAGGRSTGKDTATTIATGSGAANAGALSLGTPISGTASSRTASSDSSDVTTASSETASPDAGTIDAPLTVKPRRARRPKATADATDPSDDTAPATPASTETTATETTATGRMRKVTRVGGSADSTGSDLTTDTPLPSQERPSLPSEVTPAAASGTTATARATATGPKRTPIAPSATGAGTGTGTGSKRASAASTVVGAGATSGPATGTDLTSETGPISETGPTSGNAPTPTPGTATVATDATRASTTATGATPRAAGVTSTPDAATGATRAPSGASRAPSDATDATPATATPATAAATGATHAPSATTDAAPAPATATAGTPAPAAVSGATRASSATTDATPAPAAAGGATDTPSAATDAQPGPADAKRAPAAPATAAGRRGAKATESPRVPVSVSDTKAVPAPGSDTRAVPVASSDTRAVPATPASDTATAGAGSIDEARPTGAAGSIAGLFGGAAASDPDAARWTPAPSVWPATSSWTVPPQGAGAGATAAEGTTGPDEPTGQMPRPRHRAPLPDLSRAGTWNAFDTSRRAAPKESRGSTTASNDLAEHSGRTESPGRVEAPSDATNATNADDPADTAPAAPTPAKVAEQPSRRGRLGGLFRRNRSRADEENPETSDATEPLATQDEEFVDWVAGLSKPVSDNEPEQDNGRRSLRSTGRHHRD